MMEKSCQSDCQIKKYYNNFQKNIAYYSLRNLKIFLFSSNSFVSKDVLYLEDDPVALRSWSAAPMFDTSNLSRV